jgi:hypothetical protein
MRARCARGVLALAAIVTVAVVTGNSSAAASRITVTGRAGSYVDVTLSKALSVSYQYGLADSLDADRGDFAGVALLSQDGRETTQQIKLLKKARPCPFGPSCNDWTWVQSDGPWKRFSNQAQAWLLPAGHYRLGVLGQPGSTVTVTLRTPLGLRGPTRAVKQGRMREAMATAFPGATTPVNPLTIESADLAVTGFAAMGTVTRYDLRAVSQITSEFCYHRPEGTPLPTATLGCLNDYPQGAAIYEFYTCADPAPLCLPAVIDTDVVDSLITFGDAAVSAFQAQHRIVAVRAEVTTLIYGWRP